MFLDGVTSSTKLDFLSQAAADELPIWDRMQSSFEIEREWTSIQSVMIVAMNLRVFIWALEMQSSGSFMRHARPERML